MPIQPRTSETIYEQLQDSLTGSIAALTNFVSGTFNDLFVNAYASQVREAELKALAAQLSAYPDYAGKEITQSDLDNLGIDNVDPEEINPYMEDSDLDELGKFVGVTRDPGGRASGTVTFQVSADTTEIQEGQRVATEPDSSGDRKTYLVDADEDGEIDPNSTATVSPESGSTEVTASVIAAEIGSEYNIGSNTITFLPTQSPGVRDVSNTAEVTGGTDEQTNESLREDIKNAVFETSGGGTRRGVEGAIESRTSFEIDVGIEEFFDVSPPYVEVIADVPPDSASFTEVQSILDDVRPIGIKHTLVTPAVVSIGVKLDLLGSDISTIDVREEIVAYLTELSVGSTFSTSKLTQRALNAESNIDSIPASTAYISDIGSDRITYTDGTTDYELTYTPLGVIYDEEHFYRTDKSQYTLGFPVIDASSVTVEARINRERETLTDGTDYDVVDTDGSGSLDSIEFLDGGTTPDDSSTILVSYQHDDWELTEIRSPTGSVTYTQGTDYSVVDADGDGAPETIRWDTANTTPSDGDDFIVDYAPKRSFGDDFTASDREKIQADTNVIQLTEADN